MMRRPRARDNLHPAWAIHAVLSRATSPLPDDAFHARVPRLEETLSADDDVFDATAVTVPTKMLDVVKTALMKQPHRYNSN
jgi:hypothetical protein